MDSFSEPLLSDVSRLMVLDTICGLDNAYIGGELWDLSSTEVSVFFTGIISGVEDPNTGNINHKHSSTKDMTCSVAPKPNALNFYCLVEINNLQLPSTVRQIDNNHEKIIHVLLYLKDPTTVLPKKDTTISI